MPMEITQAIYREKTFGSYPHVEEIKRLHSREAQKTPERWGPNLGILTPRDEPALTRSVNFDKLPPLEHSGMHSARSQSRTQIFSQNKALLARSKSMLNEGYLRKYKPLLPENYNTHFRGSKQLRSRYHFIDPEWLSEVTSYRRLYDEHRSDPFRFGWA